jgi:penicillin-binding protein 1B
MLRPRLKTILFCFTILLTLVIITGFGLVASSYFSLEKEMTQKIESKKFLIPTEYYAAPASYSLRMVVNIADLEGQFLKQSYRRRTSDQRLLPGDYFIGNHDECISRLQIKLSDDQSVCFGWINKEVESAAADSAIQVVVFQNPPPSLLQDSNKLSSNNRLITMILKGAPFHDVPEAVGDAPLIAQFIGNEPLMQKTVSLGDIPPVCSNAIMSIEDAQFLKHGGVSYKGIFRALIKNLTHGKSAQGGSTITQQLVKNYFLTSEKTLKRKYNEFVMSLLLESRFSKDEILETYLNIIYMGQSGAFQVRGYGAASQYYFNKDLQSLKLSECALLAAIVNSPGLYNPFKKPINAKNRRHLVLEKMQELQFITKDQAILANQDPLPSAPKLMAVETSPYYLDAVRKQLGSMNISPEGLKIFTALDLQSQQFAQEALKNHLENLEENNKHIKDLKSKGHTLEGSVLLGDNRTGLISVAVGGRNYRMTQFNRAVDGHRQIGSIMKPFVYLAALKSQTPEGTPYLPTTLLKDVKFTIKYEGQSWSPDNYGNQYFGTVPMFFALKNSLNASTASLGLAVGLQKIADTAHNLGLESELKPLPSLTLGAFEMYPKEVLQSYMSLASFGLKKKNSFIRKVTNLNNDVIFQHQLNPEQSEDPALIASLVSMMKQTVLSGTAKSIQQSGFLNPAAGKTGTTSDNKDAWFAGFTPYLTAVVWVGYDNNLSHRLTGANGPLPIWINLMKKVGNQYPPDDFSWPENTEKMTLDESALQALGAIKGPQDPKSVELIIKKIH